MARRLALDPHDVIVRLIGVRVSSTWRTGDRRRPTSRPIRAINIETEGDNQDA
jgi:hypothetical protein